MWTRWELKSNARIVFRRNYWSCVVVAFLLSLFVSSGVAYGASETSSGSMDYQTAGDLEPIMQAISDNISVILPVVLAVLAVSFLFWILVSTVLEVGGCRFFILNRTERPKIRTMFSMFGCGHYGHVISVMVMRDIFLSLWTLLFIIPGIVKSYEYKMVPYILAENPGMKRSEVFAISKRMMQGQKWNAFILDVSFIGWGILSVITCGLVGIFWYYPYQYATYAELYAFNKAAAYREGYIGQSEQTIDQNS